MSKTGLLNSTYYSPKFSNRNKICIHVDENNVSSSTASLQVQHQPENGRFKMEIRNYNETSEHTFSDS